MITDIRLQGFRSYIDESFEISPGVNIIVGPNASGKTNILEAVLINSRGSSYKAREAEFIRFGDPWARIDIGTPEGRRTTKLVSVENGLVQKEYEILGQKLKRLPITKQTPVVLFEPNHLLLLAGSPERRREYLDDLLEQTVAGYATTLRHYKRTLAQRNRLLKAGKAAAGTQLFAWNIRLSDLGGQIANKRVALTRQLSENIPNLYKGLSNSESQVVLSYSPSCDITQYGSDMLYKLEASMEADFERGFTGYGPHRDDLLVLLDGRPLQQAASRGEVRTALLALKIEELHYLEQQRGIKPLLLLDDVFGELDGARRRALTEVLKDYQTFITTTDADVVVEHFLDKCNVIAL